MNLEKKKIIITSSPTNERIDAVMKITNMSTGALGAIIADKILEEQDLDTLFYLSSKLSYKPTVKSSKLQWIKIESTEDLLRTLRELLQQQKIYGVIHAAAVGNYYGEYAVTAEQLAMSIAKQLYGKNLSKKEMEEIILDYIVHPETLTDNSHKISSYQANLMIKLGLTPKVIQYIKQFDPNVKLIGFKLLDGVSKEELLSVATKLLKTNNADYIVANDLSAIKNGNHPATIINQNGIYEECLTKDEIGNALKRILF